MNPYTGDSDESGTGSVTLTGLESARVITAPSHSPGDNVQHTIEVMPDTASESVLADVAITQLGDAFIPTEGSRVVIGHRANGWPLVLGSRYSAGDDVPTYEAGERIIGHPLSDAYVKLASDGSIHVNGDADVVINNGDTRPVTDVDFANETVTRASNVYLPSE